LSESPAAPANFTIAEVNRLAEEKVDASDGKLDLPAARTLVFNERPELHDAYRRETTRGAGGQS
jgi:hypothetical protein